MRVDFHGLRVDFHGLLVGFHGLHVGFHGFPLGFTDCLLLSRIASCFHGLSLAFTDCRLAFTRSQARAGSWLAMGSGPVPPCNCRGTSTGARDRIGKLPLVYDSKTLPPVPSVLLIASLQLGSRYGVRGLRLERSSKLCASHFVSDSRRVGRPQRRKTTTAG